MIIVTGTIRVESAAELERLRGALVARAERSRADAGNVDYAFSTSLEDGRELRLFEVWESQEALDAHLAIPDPAFSALLGEAKIERAVVTSNVVSEQREMLRR